MINKFKNIAPAKKILTLLTAVFLISLSQGIGWSQNTDYGYIAFYVNDWIKDAGPKHFFVNLGFYHLNQSPFNPIAIVSQIEEKNFKTSIKNRRYHVFKLPSGPQKIRLSLSLSTTKSYLQYTETEPFPLYYDTKYKRYYFDTVNMRRDIEIDIPKTTTIDTDIYVKADEVKAYKINLHYWFKLNTSRSDNLLYVYDFYDKSKIVTINTVQRFRSFDGFMQWCYDNQKEIIKHFP